MARYVDSLDGWIQEGKWPLLPCPTCLHPTLRPIEVTNADSAEATRNRRHQDWQPDWMSGTFRALFECSDISCGERVTVAGDYGTDVFPRETYDDPHWADYYRVRATLPALPILSVPSGTPESVRKSIGMAAAIVWMDPNAAAGRLRIAVEQLLTSFRIPVSRVGKDGKRHRLSLHSRILRFKKSHQVAGDALEAVKWIGNSGSHPSGVTTVDVLDCAEMLEYALRDLYDKTDATMRRRIQTVNKARGVPRRRAK